MKSRNENQKSLRIDYPQRMKGESKLEKVSETGKKKREGRRPLPSIAPLPEYQVDVSFHQGN